MLKKNFFNYVYLIILGAISALSLPPYNYFIINFITFSLFFIFLFNKKKKNNKNFFKYGWFFGFGYFLSGLYWISISLTFDENFKFLIPISIIALPSFLGIFYGLISYFFSIFHSKKVVESFLIFSILFGTIELVRGFILTGFPWNLIAFSFSEQIFFIQILSVIGTYSFNLICISFVTLPSLIFLNKSKESIFLFFFFVVVAGYFFIFVTIKNNQFDSKSINKHNYTIRVISSNISINRFYLEQNEPEIINELINLSQPEADKPTIFLWPEGVITETNLENMKIYENLFSSKFSKNHLIILGVNSFDKKKNKEKYFNSLGVFDKNLNLISSYNKNNLVPFGEFLPFQNILENFGLKTITNNYQPFSKGTERNFLKINDERFKLNLLPLICYEIIYSGRLFKDYNFDYIINISEDGWFGKSIGTKQHFSHSVFRSLESGKYILRSTNNGISAIINPIGKIDKKLRLGETNYIDFTESKSTETSIFSKYGNKMFVFIILLYIFLFFSLYRNKK